MKLLTLLATIALAALAFPAGSAGHCQTWTTATPEADTTTVGGSYYFDVDGLGDGVWIYEESNGFPGLQRGDSLQDDTCHGMIESDTIIF